MPPTEITGIAGNCCFMCCRLFKLASVKGAPLKPPFLLYAGLTLLGCIFVWLYIPETKQVSLEKIEENLYAHKKLRHLGDH